MVFIVAFEHSSSCWALAFGLSILYVLLAIACGMCDCVLGFVLARARNSLCRVIPSVVKPFFVLSLIHLLRWSLAGYLGAQAAADEGTLIGRISRDAYDTAEARPRRDAETLPWLILMWSCCIVFSRGNNERLP